MNIPFSTLKMSTLTLSFDVAYAQYGGQYSDTLEVLVSTDCGTTFTSVFIKGGTTLGTAPNSSNYFIPTATQWRTENINLSSFVNEEQVIVAFRNDGHWGNNIYVDNINITSNLGNVELQEKSLSVYPNPIEAGNKLMFEGVEYGAHLKFLDPNGKLIVQGKLVDHELKLPENLTPGVYWLNIESSSEIVNKKIIIR
jgi:hypothetical protein